MGLKDLISHPVRTLAVLLIAAAAFGLLGASVNAAAFDYDYARREGLYSDGHDYAVSLSRYEGDPALFLEKAGRSGILAKAAEISYTETPLVDWAFFTAESALPSPAAQIAPPAYLLAAADGMEDFGVGVIGRLPEKRDEVALPVCMYALFRERGYYDRIAYPPEGSLEEGYTFDPRGVRAVPDPQTLANGSFRVLLRTEGEPLAATIVGVVDYGVCPHEHTASAYTMPEVYDNLFVSRAYLEEYSALISGHIDSLLFPKGKDVAADETFYRTVLDEGLTFSSAALTAIENSGSILLKMKRTFLWIGVGLSVFCAGLIYQFISFSLEKKKSEIGVLRALGAGRKDIYRIFLTESLLLGLIQAALGILLTGILIPSINRTLVRELAAPIVFMRFTAWAPPVIFLVSLAVSFVASFLPIRKTANRSPVEAIRINEI